MTDSIHPTECADRYQIETDGLTYRPRFSRRFAVVDTHRMDGNGKPMAILETDDSRRAQDYADEVNREWRRRV
jgi:hypothetical protein